MDLSLTDVVQACTCLTAAPACAVLCCCQVGPANLEGLLSTASYLEMPAVLEACCQVRMAGASQSGMLHLCALGDDVLCGLMLGAHHRSRPTC